MSSDKVPRGLRSLPPKKEISNQQFADQLKNEADAINRWWSHPRWQHTKRVYSGTFLLLLLCVFESIITPPLTHNSFES